MQFALVLALCSLSAIPISASQNGPSAPKPQNKNVEVEKTPQVNITLQEVPKKAEELPKKINVGTESLQVDSGAFTRAVWVFVGISVLFMMYLGFRTYRGNKNRSNVIVRKYGVRARRSDIEMEPLQSEDEDETVFDVKSVNK